MPSQNPVIIWFRRDLRLGDNPALHAGLQSGKPLILLYIDEINADRPLGGAAKVWQHHSLLSLKSSIEAKGGALILRRGAAADILDDIIAQTGADIIHWNRRYAGQAREIDAAIKTGLKARGLSVQSYKANLLTEPWEVQTKTGGFYKVFTPFWRAVCRDIEVAPPIAAPHSLNCFAGLQSADLESWNLRPTAPDWGASIIANYEPGEAGAMACLTSFLGGPVEDYLEQRDRPDDETGTSKLSPHLAFGEISPRQIWMAAKQSRFSVDKFLAQIGWREFSYMLLFYNPELAAQNYKPHFDKFAWDSDPTKVEAWRRGCFAIFPDFQSFHPRREI